MGIIADDIRPDHRVIFDWIEQGARVLDLGCGDGELMDLLSQQKDTRVQGIELDEKAIYECVKKGLSVCQGDIEIGLAEYPDRCFDYVILNQSLQEIRKASFLLREALRVGARAIVGFPNFAHVGARVSLFFGGRAPMTPSLPYRWYDTPNVRFLSIGDFRVFCTEMGFLVEKAAFLDGRETIAFWPNLRALSAIFLLSLPADRAQAGGKMAKTQTKIAFADR
jgi:methionine biosynthesis protein MetW